MTKFVLTIGVDGTVTGLYNDRLPYRELGRLSVQRASDVSFDEERQVWIAKTPEGKVLAESPNRDACIKGEIAALQGGVC